MVASSHLSKQFYGPHDTPYAEDTSNLGPERFDSQLMHIPMPHELDHFQDVMVGEDDPSETGDIMEDQSVARAKRANKLVSERNRATHLTSTDMNR